ncbi:quinon protein alcohol dehydrogenase-like superfamily [Hygrophoropsis aurantiaca]|uniref:Quinon protein alcohol dehydrogenase-like superfamily n=1 Tax=Hygrophoropsis aurantiaca TaxID=72124 RepID=A0ACB8AER8_9AGAM|nr:quinon protein alcohol dehydrogenase-like superfamily [Hygrophoropsis aurantiaca]
MANSSLHPPRTIHVSPIKIPTINCIAFSPDGLSIAGGTNTFEIQIFDPQSAKIIGAALKGHSDIINSVAYSHDGRKIVTSSFDGTVRVWDSATCQAIGSPFTGHSDQIILAQFLQDDIQVLSGSRYGEIIIWNHERGEVTKTFHIELSGGVAVVSPDGRRLVSAGGSIRKLWDVDTGIVVAEIRDSNPSPILLSAAFSADGKCVVFGAGDDALKLWKLDTEEKLVSYRGHKSIPASVALSPDSRRMASATREGTIRLWDVATNKCIAGPVAGSGPLAFSPNGQYLASQSLDGKLHIRDISEPNHWAKVKSPPGSSNSSYLDLPAIAVSHNTPRPDIDTAQPSGSAEPLKIPRRQTRTRNRSDSFDSILDLPAFPEPEPTSSRSVPADVSGISGSVIPKPPRPKPPSLQLPTPDPPAKPGGLKHLWSRVWRRKPSKDKSRGHQRQDSSNRGRNTGPNVALGKLDERLYMASQKKKPVRRGSESSESVPPRSPLEYQGPCNYICFCQCFGA